MNVALPSMPYFFYYSLLGNDTTTHTFDDLLNPHFYPQHASVRLLCKPDIIRQFLGVQKPLQVYCLCILFIFTAGIARRILSVCLSVRHTRAF